MACCVLAALLLGQLVALLRRWGIFWGLVRARDYEDGSNTALNWAKARLATPRAKRALAAAVVVTGQAEAGQDDTYRRIGESVTAMLGQALLVRAFVPSTFPMLLVAAGQHDVFWQYEPVLPGVAAGALLITEAGGTVSRIDGSAWSPGSPDILAAAPGLHQAAADVLAAVG